MKVNYISRNGKKYDIRGHVGKALTHYNVTQGTCSDGVYIYMCFEQKTNKEKGRPHRIKIVKMVAETLKVIKVSAPLNLGHGNDLTYRDGTLYVTHSAGAKVIHTVSAKTLKKGKDIKITIPNPLKGCSKEQRKKITAFNGICKVGSGYALRITANKGFLYLDKNFKVKHYTKYSTDHKTAQGTTANDKQMVRAFSSLQSDNKNFIVTYKFNGKEKKKISLDVLGEMECVFYVGQELWGSIYRKKKKQGKMNYYAFLFKIPI